MSHLAPAHSVVVIEDEDPEYSVEASPSSLLEPLLEENRETYGVLLDQSHFHDRRLTVSHPVRFETADFDYVDEKLEDVGESDGVVEIESDPRRRDEISSEIMDLAANGWQQGNDYLEKLSPTKFRGWQRRWFYLWESDLDYYKDKICPPKGTISLYDVESVTYSKVGSDGPVCLELQMKESSDMFPNRIYKLKASSASRAHEWYMKLNCNLLLCSRIPRPEHDDGHGVLTLRLRRMPSAGSGSKGDRALSPHTSSSLTEIDGVSSPPPPPSGASGASSPSISPLGEPRYKTTALSVGQHGKSGDIILFRAHNAAGSMVRTYTGGNYDHIGLVFRFKGDEVGLLESLGSTGVSIFLWKNFLKEKWYEQYPRMVIRRLICKDKKLRKKMLSDFSKFVKTVVDREYSWNPMKIIRRNSDLPLDDPSRTFFCSELVAKALKEAHLLRPNLSSTAYYPSSFEENANLKLLNGCFYGPEELIVFDNPKNM